MIHAPQSSNQLIDIDAGWFRLAKQYDVVAVPLLVVAPIVLSGKTSKNVADSLFTAAVLLFIERHPLRHDATRLEPFLAHLNIFAGVQTRRSLSPRGESDRR